MTLYDPRDALLAALSDSGRELVQPILADLDAAGLEPDSRELALLRTAGELRDRMTELEAAVEQDGLRRETKAGGVQLHPAASELRQHAVALSRVLAGIALVDTSGKSARHQRAAAVRWAKASDNG